MERHEFRIGLEFWCGGKPLRCTDVGTRVIVAISLGPHEVVEVTSDARGYGARTERRYMTDDTSWHSGPPYAIAESVFDEYDLEACSLLREG
jgi:hypothetical protein